MAIDRATNPPQVPSAGDFEFVRSFKQASVDRKKMAIEHSHGFYGHVYTIR